MLDMKIAKRAISCIMALAILFTGSPAVVTANELFSNDIQKYKSSTSASQRSDLAPSTIAENKASQENYLAAELILSEKAHNAFIRRQIEKIVAARGEAGLQEKQLKIDGNDVLVIAIPSLLRGTGNFAHVGLGRQYGRAVIYVDADMFNNDENLNAIVRHEAFEISQWETVRKNLGLEPGQMRGWIRANIDKPVSKTVLDGTKYAKSTGMTVRELARQIHNDAESLEKLYEKYGEKIKIKADYIAKLVTLYRKEGTAVTPDEILYDAQKTPDLTVAAGRAPPVDAAIGGSEADKTARSQKISWIAQNQPELKDKVIVSLSMEGNIPEFKGYGSAEYANTVQRANTKGGLGAYFGDKLEGFAKVGLNGIGMQPGYSHLKIDGKNVSVEEEYKRLIADGIMVPVFTGKDAIMVRAWDEDPTAHTQDAEDRLNPQVAVEVYKINRGGTTDYIIRSKVLDVLYTNDRVHRFTQEIVFGKAVYEICDRLNIIPDMLHLNEAHTVVAAALMRANPKFNRMAIVYTNHTIVPAGLEMFSAGQLRSDINRMMYVIGVPGSQAEKFRSIFLRQDGVVDFCYAAAQLADIINGVSKEHGEATRKLLVSMYGERFNTKIPGILNGSGDVWKNPDLLNIEASGKVPTEKELWDTHEAGKKEAFDDIERRTGIKLKMNKVTAWMVRRLVDYKSQYPMMRFLLHIMTAEKDQTFTREELQALWERDIPDLAQGFNKGLADSILNRLFKNGTIKKINGLGMQVVIGCPNPEDSSFWDTEFTRLKDLDTFKGKFVYIRDSESELLRMQAIGADVCINMPRPLEEACGTSDQRTGLNGGVNIALGGAGPVEWIEEYDEKTGKGSGFLFGPYTYMTEKGLEAENDKFYLDGPAAIFEKAAIISRLYYEPKKAKWRHLMHNSYLAANELVTSAAMEQRYSQDVYPQAIRNRTDTKTIYEMVLRDYHDPKTGISGLNNAQKELPFLAEAGVKTIYLLGLMEHTGRPFEVLNPRNIDFRAGTFEDLRRFIAEAKKSGIKVVAIDWLANQHLSKESPICAEYPDRFLYTNASDGNYWLDRDSKLLKGRDLSREELEGRIALGKKINIAIQAMQKKGELKDAGEIDIDGRKISYRLGDRDIRAKVGGVDPRAPAVIVSADDALFLVSATDLVSLKTQYSHRWPQLAQPDLSHPDVMQDAISTGRFWLARGLEGFRIDAALSTFPDRIKENWGLDVNENLTAVFIREMRKINPNCFFLFEAFERQPELLNLADNKEAAAYSATSRDLVTYALLDPANINNLIMELRQFERGGIFDKLVNVGPEHDAFNFGDTWAKLGYQDRNLLYFLYSFLPGYRLVFNGEAYGSQHNFKNDMIVLAPDIDTVDAAHKDVRKTLFSFGIFNRAIPYGTYHYLETDKPENGIGVARFDNTREIVIGALNVTNNDGWTVLGLRRLINVQAPDAEKRKTTYYVKESLMLDASGTKWIPTETMTLSADDLYKHGLAVHLGPKTAEMIRLTKVEAPVVADKGSPAEGLRALYRDGFFNGKSVTVKEFAKLRGYSETTARVELNTLSALGLVVAERDGKRYTYYLTNYFGRSPPAEAQTAVEKIAAIPEMNLFDPKEHIAEIQERIAEILPAQALSPAGVSNIAADAGVSEFGNAVKSDVDATLAFFASNEIAPGLNDGMIHVIRYNETRLRECPFAVDILKAYVELLKTRSVHKNNIILIPTTTGLITVHSYKDKDAYAQNNPTGEGVIDMQGSLSDQDLKVTRLVNMAIAASHIRRDIPLAQMEDAENRLLDYIRKQYEMITGKAASPGQILAFIKDLPRSLPLPTKRIEEYNKLTVRQLEQAA